MNEQEIKEMMDKKNKEFDEQAKVWEKKQEEAKRRIKNAIDWKYYSLDSYVFLYQSGPMDHYENWKPMHTFSHNIFNKFMKGENEGYGLTIHKEIYRMERLLLMGLIHYANYFINDLRGELMHYTFVHVDNEHLTYCDATDIQPVICIKQDNNGTMAAFSFNPFIAKNIPHDNGCDWELIDAQLTQFKKTSSKLDKD